MLLNSRLVSLVFALSLGFATSASAAGTAKSWDVDLYGDQADVTYVDDGYDDINVYDHGSSNYNNNYNDNYNQHDYGYRRPQVTYHYDRGGRYGDYDNSSYSPRHGRAYRSRYYDGYRGW